MTDPMDMGPLPYLLPCKVIFLIKFTSEWDSVPVELLGPAEAMLSRKTRLMLLLCSKTGSSPGERSIACHKLPS